MIYWARSGDIGPTKVGYAASDVTGRIAGLQAGNPLPLILLRTEPGDLLLEAALHRHYRAKHVRGEWFLLSHDEVFVDLSTVQFRERPRPRQDAWEGSPSGKIIRAMGGHERVAADFGATRTAVYNWRHDGIPSRLWPDFVELAAARGIAGITFEALKATQRRAREAPALGPASEAAA